MFRLTREVRFAVNAQPDEQLAGPPGNSFGGFPALTGAGQFFALQVTVAGQLERQTGYLLNIKQVDDGVRREVIPLVSDALRGGSFGGGAGILLRIFQLLRPRFGAAVLDRIKMDLSPFLGLEVRASELPMVRLSHKFEFSASHRLHNPALSDEQNRQAFGKCNNPYGHGHNYELQVTLIGEPDGNGLLIDVPAFEQIVTRTVIDRLDHRNLNLEVAQFQDLVPSVENIAMVIYRMLQPQLEAQGARLASVTVWETPKTWCEYAP